MIRLYYVYILASKRNGTLYIGMTNNLARRVWEHRHGLVEGFTKRYNVHLLVHAECYERPRDAIQREKQLAWFRSHAKKYQTYMNAVLRCEMQARPRGR